ncbi:hypothetical protein SprV_0100002500 [Sparganum proliferum]
MIFACLLLNRLNSHLKQGLLSESQCGFRRNRETSVMIFTVRQLKHKREGMQTYLYTTFLDLTKALDTVNCDAMWKIMQEFGCPERFTEMLRQLHDRIIVRVTGNGAISEAFVVANGAKRDCVLVPHPGLFSLKFLAMLMDDYRDESPGIRIAFKTEGHLPSSRHIRAPTRLPISTVHDLLLAGDCVLNITTGEERGPPRRQLCQEAEPLPSQLSPQNTEAGIAEPDPGHGSPGADQNSQHPRRRHAEATATAMERPPDEDWRLPKQLFYGDVAAGANRRAGQQRRQRDTFRDSSKRSHINPKAWNYLTQGRPTRGRAMMTDAAVYRAIQIVAAKTKRAVTKSQAPWAHGSNGQPLSNQLS